MPLNKVTIRRQSSNGDTHIYWFALETEHTSLAEMHAALIADGLIHGVRYDVRKAPEGNAIGHCRGEIIVAKSSVVEITPLDFDIVRE